MSDDPARRDDVPSLPAHPGSGAADADDVRALLSDLRDLRLGLAADLGLVASAVEIDAHDVAAEVVDGRRADLAELSERVAARISSGSRFRRTAGGLRPAAPALAAAAALVTVLLGLLPALERAEPDHVRTPAASASEAASAAPSAPERSAEASAAASAQARRLHEEISRIIVTAPRDPLSAQDALGRVAVQIPTVRDPRQRADLTVQLRSAQQWVAQLQGHGGAGIGPVVAGTLGLPSAPPSTSPSTLPEPTAPATPRPPSPSATPAPAPAPAPPAARPSASPPAPGLPAGEQSGPSALPRVSGSSAPALPDGSALGQQ